MANNTIDPALAFFHEMVEPTVEEFLANPQDKRRGCLACLVLSSMADHYYQSRPAPVDGHTDVHFFRRSLGTATWAFGQVLGVANATKHVLRRKGRVGFEDVTVQEIQLGLFQCGWPMNGEETMVETRPGDIWLLSQLVEAATDVWRQKLGLPIHEQC